MAKLGFLGLGIMGYPMARHLLHAGHEVALWSNTGSKAIDLAKEGQGAVCASPREVAEGAFPGPEHSYSANGAQPSPAKEREEVRHGAG